MAFFNGVTLLLLTLNLVAGSLLFAFPPLNTHPELARRQLLYLLAGFIHFKASHHVPINAQANPLLAFALALSIPVCVAGIIPVCLAEADAISGIALFGSEEARVVHVVGVVLGLIGILLLIWTSKLFYVVGKGTFSPDEKLSSTRLILVGPYRYTRNPMITGAAFVLVAHAFVANSPRVLLFAVLFVPIKTLYFIYVEEPELKSKFGQEYVNYMQQVPRWIPTLAPYRLPHETSYY